MAICRLSYETKCSAYYVKMVPDSTLDVAPHGTRTSEAEKVQKRLEYGYISLCLQIYFLLTLPVGTTTTILRTEQHVGYRNVGTRVNHALTRKESGEGWERPNNSLSASKRGRKPKYMKE
jgi:hypothetical protein